MSADSNREPRPDATPPATRRTFLLVAIAAVLVLIAGAGWYGVTRWQAAQTAKRETWRAGELHEKIAVKAQPLTDAEFDETLDLTAAADPEARFVALLTATAYAKRHRPDLADRVRPVADRLANDSEPAVRQKAIQCQTALKLNPAP